MLGESIPQIPLTRMPFLPTASSGASWHDFVKGQWRYLYRAVDKYGKTIDFVLMEHRDKDSKPTP